jgi:hypothetical protein
MGVIDRAVRNLAQPLDVIDGDFSHPLDVTRLAVQSATNKGGAPITTFRQTIAPWYANIDGGVDAAIDASVDNIRHKGLPGQYGVNDRYGAFTQADADAPITVVTDYRFSDPLDPTTAAHYDRTPSGGKRIVLNHDVVDPNSPMTLSHESTHAGFLRDRLSQMEASVPPWGAGDINTEARRVAALNIPVSGRGKKYTKGQKELTDYLFERQEVDPRLAEVRRVYALEMGRLPKTPEEFEKAWNWYRIAGMQRLLNTGYKPTMSPLAYRMYNSLPAQLKEVLFKRGVQVPSVMAAGALSGLTKNPQQPAEEF